MTDKEFLSWIYDRMIYKHGENKNVDYMLKFRSIIDSLQEEPVSDDLEEAAKRYATEGDEISGLYIIDEEADAFKAGAQWQKQKDALTWQDMKEVWSFGDDLPPMAEETFFQAMLEHINKRRYGKEDS